MNLQSNGCECTCHLIFSVTLTSSVGVKNRFLEKLHQITDGVTLSQIGKFFKIQFVRLESLAQFGDDLFTINLEEICIDGFR